MTGTERTLPSTERCVCGHVRSLHAPEPGGLCMEDEWCQCPGFTIRVDDPPWDEDPENPAVQVRDTIKRGAKIARMRTALEFITELPPGSKGAYAKFSDAQERAREALGLRVKK